MKASFLSLLALIACATNSFAAEKPNFVIIFCDDLGYGDLSSFGHPTIKTPNLDTMATEGQKWTNFYVAACVCTPSRAGLLTGRLPVRNGMCSDTRRVLFPDSSGGLPTTEITISSALKKSGYHTAAIGKWHLGHLPEFLPTKHGFDSYFGIPYSNDMDPIRRVNPIKAAEEENWEAYNLPLMRDEEIIERPVNQTTITRRYTEEAVKKIEGFGDEPFFIYLAHNLPHIPLFRGKDFKDTSTAGIYGDVVEELDWSVGEIRKALEKSGVSENTLVIFTSDNGPWLPFKQHGGSAGMLRDGKGSTWEGGMREPTIIAWPGIIQPGIVHDMGATLDLLPTFVSLAGGTLPDDRTYDGVDLSATLKGETDTSPRDEMFYYHGEQLFAVRKGQYKAHFKTKTSYSGQKKAEVHNPPLLYHLGSDPGEQWDIAKQHPDIVKELQDLSASHTKGVKPVPNNLNGVIGK